MKKKWIPILTLGVGILCTGAAYLLGGSASDPFVSFGYLSDTYLPSLMKQVEKQVETSVSASYHAVADSIPQSSSDGKVIAASACSREDTVTLTEGATLLLSEGSATVVMAGGSIIDATTGTEGTAHALLPMHRYLIGEGGTATVAVRSDKAVLLLEGQTSLYPAGLPKLTPFTDLCSTDWYYAPVRYAYENALLTGMTETTFCPKTALTRAMFATVLFRMAGEPTDSPHTTPFSDVPPGAWYAKSVCWAFHEGIVKGMEETLFIPNGAVTREQLAVMLYGYETSYLEHSLPEGAATLTAFTDGNTVSGWAKEAVLWAVDAGILSGRNDGTLDPKGPATRAEVCTVLQRFLKDR